MVFYNPFTMELGSIPAIVYPSKGAEAVFDRKDKGCVKKYLRGLWDLHKGILSHDTEYAISILWNEGQNKMVDLWLNRKVEEYGFGPLVEVRVFRNFDAYLPQPNAEEGHSCGNAIACLEQKKITEQL